MITFNDQIAQLSASFTFTPDKLRLGLLAKKAVSSCYTEIGAKSSWNYLRRTTLINTIASYQTGTIQYDAVTRTLTLTDGVWPLNAVDSEVLINRNIYEVQKRVDNTHLILLAGNCPIADIPSGTTYAIAQTQYLLPREFAELRGITETAQLWNVTYVSPEVMLAQSQWWSTPTQPWYFTILGAGGAGRMYMQFLPPPNVALTFSVLFQSKPRVPVLTGMYSTGAVTATIAGTTVTLAGGAFPKNLDRGCVFRLGNTAVPTGEYGENPYVEEHLIASRTSDTVIELMSPMESSVTGIRYSVDDPIDLEQMSMQSYFDRYCEARLLRLHQSDRKTIVEAEQAASNALKDAQAMDSRLNPSSNFSPLWATNLPEALFYSAQVHP